ncbi:hypothetical protein FOL47_011302 [Perkinsus chesapeaki]|uniref:Uncharacterized protein n=1 Tax=Perkinsus chesapeaki TaxID=330153 RepID=A0A7J6L009_PERCH|nr:hypothetical protein FOL47_011302 [Perkinsus chesapeaki]
MSTSNIIPADIEDTAANPTTLPTSRLRSTSPCDHCPVCMMPHEEDDNKSLRVCDECTDTFLTTPQEMAYYDNKILKICDSCSDEFLDSMSPEEKAYYLDETDNTATKLTSHATNSTTSAGTNDCSSTSLHDSHSSDTKLISDGTTIDTPIVTKECVSTTRGDTDTTYTKQMSDKPNNTTSATNDSTCRKRRRLRKFAA